MQNLQQEARSLALEFIEKSKIKKGQIVVIGCSTSEVVGENIGTHSTKAAAEYIYEGLHSAFTENGIYMAAQCCEHLNRALIVERSLAEKLGMDEVNVIPQIKAGGSFATTCYERFSDAVAVEHIKANGGIDIGGTLIGMHLKEVAVPMRLEHKKLGEAIVLTARVRAKFVGGSRAIYKEELL